MNAQFQLPSGLSEALAAAETRIASTALLTERTRGFVVSAEEAKAARDAAVDERTARDTELALATDEKAAKALEAKVIKASAAVDETQQLLDRRERVLGALKLERDKAAKALREEIVSLETSIQAFSTHVYDFVSREIHAAAPALIAALRMAWVLELSTQRGWMRQTLEEIHVEAPGRRGIIVTGERSHVDAVSTPLHAGWADEPELAETHRIARQPIEMLRRLQVLEGALRKEIKPDPPGHTAKRQQSPEEAAAEEAAARAEQEAVQARRAAEPHVRRGYTLERGAFG